MTGGRVSQEVPFAMVPRWVVQALGLDRSAIAVYCALAGYASDVRRAFPSIRTLAQDLCCSSSTVRLALNRLERSGAVVVERRWRGRGRASSLYHLPFNPMVAIAYQAAAGAVDKSVGEAAGV